MLTEPRQLTCIQCPLGCRLTVSPPGPGGPTGSERTGSPPTGSEQITVTGNRCPKGKTWAMEEILAPHRILTTSVRVLNGSSELVSVKSASSIPLSRLEEVQEWIRSLRIEAPIEPGQTVAGTMLDLPVALIATKGVHREPGTGH